MRKTFPDILEKGRHHDPKGSHRRGDPYGSFTIKSPTTCFLLVIACDGDEENWKSFGWQLPAFDHVSVSVISPFTGNPEPRCPTWEEMCFVKDLFWEPEECVIQYHPPKSRHVNYHPHCLHMWKPVGVEIPLPPMKAIA